MHARTHSYGLDGGGIAYIGKVKSIDKITHILSAPRSHTSQHHVGVAFRFEPFINEQDLRVVVASFRENSPTACPG